MRLSGKFNHEEAEIIKKFMEKHFQYGDAIITDDELEFVNEKYGKPRKLTANQLVRCAMLNSSRVPFHLNFHFIIEMVVLLMNMNVLQRLLGKRRAPEDQELKRNADDLKRE